MKNQQKGLGGWSGRTKYLKNMISERFSWVSSFLDVTVMVIKFGCKKNEDKENATNNQ